MSADHPDSLIFTGAELLAEVVGLVSANEGLRLKVKQEQQRGWSKVIKGRFELVSAGIGDYSEQLRPFEGQTFSANDLIDEVLQQMSRSSKHVPKTLQIFNCNILGLVNRDHAIN